MKYYYGASFSLMVLNSLILILKVVADSWESQAGIQSRTARTATSFGALLETGLFDQDLSYYFIQKRNEMINPDVRPENLNGQNVGRPTWCHLLSEKSIDSFAESRHKRPVNKKL